MESVRPVMSELVERSGELERGAGQKSRAFIHGLMQEANLRWTALVNRTENKQMALQVHTDFLHRLVCDSHERLCI